MILSGINTVISLLLLDNFIYNHFVAVEFFEDNKNKKDICIDLFLILAISSLMNYIVFRFYPYIMNIDENYYLINILSLNLSILILGRIRNLEGRKLYYGSSAFLIWLVSYNAFSSLYITFLFVIIMPFFIYLNLFFFGPLFEKIRIENKKGLVSYNVIFIIVIAFISLIFNAFTGW